MESEAVERVVIGYAEWHEREACSLRLHCAHSPMMPELAEMHAGTAATLRALLAERDALRTELRAALEMFARRDMTCAGCCGPSAKEEEFPGYVDEARRMLDEYIRDRSAEKGNGK